MTLDLATIGIEFRTEGLVKGTAALKENERQAGRTADAADRTGVAAKRASESFSSLGNVLRGLGVGLVLREFIQLSDQYTKYTAQLKLATQSTQEYARANQEVQRIAKLTEGGLSSIGVLYARITNATRDFGTSQAQVAKISETVGLALKVAGAGAAESGSAMLQLSQAFGAGALRGEEFNAISEAAPGLLRVLAESMGVATGSLKSMAAEGALTTAVLTKAFTDDRVLAGLREQAMQVRTISGAIQLFKDQLVLFVGESNNATGAGAALANAIGVVARNLDLITAAALGYGAAKLGGFLLNAADSAVTLVKATLESVAAANASRAAAIAEAQAKTVATSAAVALTTARVAELRAAVLASEGAVALDIATNGLIPAQGRAAVAAEAHALALANLAKSQAVATGAAGLASRAMGLFGGPIGVITTLLGIGVTAWLAWGGASKEGNDIAAQSTETSTRDILRNLDAQNEKLRQRLDLARQGDVAIARSGGEGAEELASILEKINKLRAKGNELTGVEKIDLVTLQGYYNDLSKSLTTNAGLQGEINGLSDQAKSKDWLAKYATDAEKLTNELAKAKKELGSAFTPDIEKRIRASFNKGAVKEFNKELSEQAKLLAEFAGLSPDYLKDLSDLEAIRKKGNVTEAQYIALVEQLIAKQPSSIKLAKEQADAIKQVADAEEDGLKQYEAMLDVLRKGVTTQRERITALETEAEAERLAETLNISLARAVELVNIAKLEERRLSERDPAVIKALEDEIAARKRIAELTGNKDAREVSRQAAQDAANEWKRFYEDLERGLTDSLFRAFEAGRGFFSTLWDGIKNLFKTTVLKLAIQGVVGSVLGSVGLSSAAQTVASTGGSGLSALSNLGSLDSTVSGFGAAFGTSFGANLSASFASGFSTVGLSLEAGLASIAQGTVTGIASGLGSLAAVAAPVAAVALVANALGLFRSNKIVDGGISGTLGGQVNDYALNRRGGTLFSGPDYSVRDLGVSAQNQALQDAYSAIRNTVSGMAVQLGIGNDAIKDFTVQLGNDLIHPDTGGFGIKTQGLTQDEIIKKIEAALVSANDQLAAFALGTTEFSREGETAAQTLGRLAGSLQTVNGTFELLGLTLADASLAGADAASKFIDLFGGVEQFGQIANSYYQNFYTEAERTANTVEALRQRFFELGTAGATTREGFRALVEEQQRLHGATSPVVAELLKLESTFASVVPAIDAVTQAAAQQAEQAQQQAAAINAERSDRLRIERETAQAAKAAADELAKLNEQNFRLAISAGNIGKAIASSSQTGPRLADYQGPGGFNAAGYNAANIAAQQRSYQQVLADTQRQNPFEVADYFGVISELQRNIASLTDNLNSGEFNGGSSSIEQAAQQAFGGFLNPEQIQAAADGLTSFSNVLSLVSGTAAQGAIGADQALRVLEGAYTGTARQSVEYARGLEIIGNSVGVATGNLQDIQAAIRSGLDYFNSGEYYQAIAQEQLRVQVQFTSRAFTALTQRAASFNTEAEGLETSFDVLDGFIGRLKSVQDAFANGAGDRAAEAGLISDAASRISEIITTPVAEAARNALADLPSFAGLDDGKLRDLSLLLKDLGQFDNAGLEKTFIRVSEALASGTVTGEQYAALIKYTESVYLGTATALNAVAEAGAAAADILREREGLELRILQLQGNTAELRRRELEALDPSNRAFQEFIYLLEDQARLEADATRLADAFGSIRDSVRNLIDGLVIDGQRSILSPSQILGEAERQYRMNLAGAFEGDTQAAGQLGGSVNALLEAARNSATSEVDYNRTFGRTVGDLQGLESFAGQRATTDDVVAELRAVRAELAEVNKELDAQRAELRAGMAQIASNTAKTKDQLQGWTVNGLPATET